MKDFRLPTRHLPLTGLRVPRGAPENGFDSAAYSGENLQQKTSTDISASQPQTPHPDSTSHEPKLEHLPLEQIREYLQIEALPQLGLTASRYYSRCEIWLKEARDVYASDTLRAMHLTNQARNFRTLAELDWIVTEIDRLNFPALRSVSLETAAERTTILDDQWFTAACLILRCATSMPPKYAARVILRICNSSPMNSSGTVGNFGLGNEGSTDRVVETKAEFYILVLAKTRILASEERSLVLRKLIDDWRLLNPRARLAILEETFHQIRSLPSKPRLELTRELYHHVQNFISSEKTSEFFYIGDKFTASREELQCYPGILQCLKDDIMELRPSKPPLSRYNCSII